jgi:hypothetical protein
MSPLRDEPNDAAGFPGRKPKSIVRWLLATNVVVPVAGFLSGVALDANYHINYINFYVDNNTKLSLQPSTGDIITWTSYQSKVNPQINFVANQAPCDPKTSTMNTCKYDPSLTKVNMDVYGCSLNGSQGACSDPGVGPKSVPGGGSVPTLTLREFLAILTFDIKMFFGFTPDLSDNNIRLLARREASLPKNENRAATVLAAIPATTAMSAEVLCNNSKPAVEDADQNPLPSITATPNEIITWYPYVGYTITGLDNICNYLGSGKGLSSSDNTSCQIKPSAAMGTTYYTVNTNNSLSGINPCGNSQPSDFSIQVVIPSKPTE